MYLSAFKWYLSKIMPIRSELSIKPIINPTGQQNLELYFGRNRVGTIPIVVYKIHFLFDKDKT
jgi:hypothetical protein